MWHHVSRESASCAGRARVGYLAVDHNCFAGRCLRDQPTQRVGRHGHHPIRNAGDRVRWAWVLPTTPNTQLHWQGAAGASAAPRSRRRRRGKEAGEGAGVGITRGRSNCGEYQIGRPGRTWKLLYSRCGSYAGFRRFLTLIRFQTLVNLQITPKKVQNPQAKTKRWLLMFSCRNAG